MQQVDPTQPIQDAPKRGVSVADLKKVIDMLPLETSAVSAVANRLAQLTPEQFAFLLTELARDNHAFRYPDHILNEGTSLTKIIALLTIMHRLRTISLQFCGMRVQVAPTLLKQTKLPKVFSGIFFGQGTF